MARNAKTLAVVIALAVIAGLVSARVPLAPPVVARGSAMDAPSFTHTQPVDWINSPPLTTASLRGDVWLINFWTFGCSNCSRSLPWLTAVESRFRERGLRVIGVHTPEFTHERLRGAVEKHTRQSGVTYPVVLDNDFSYWKAVGNQYWPTFYLVDRQGRIRGRFAGETHAGDQQAHQIERLIEVLLAERS